MQTRDRQNMDRARGEEVVGLRAGQRLATAEEQRRGEGRPFSREVGIEHGDAPPPQAVDRRGKRPSFRRRHESDESRRRDAHDREAAARPAAQTEVELTRISGGRRPQAAAQHADPITQLERRRLTIDDHGGTTGGGHPAATGADRVDPHHALTRRPDRGGPPRILRRHGQKPKRLLDRASHRHGDGRVAETPGEICPLKEVKLRG